MKSFNTLTATLILNYTYKFCFPTKLSCPQQITLNFADIYTSCKNIKCNTRMFKLYVILNCNLKPGSFDKNISFRP